VHKVVHAWKRNPLTDLDKIVPSDMYPQYNHLEKILMIIS